jgi:hypothetical protein
MEDSSPPAHVASREGAGTRLRETNAVAFSTDGKGDGDTDKHPKVFAMLTAGMNGYSVESVRPPQRSRRWYIGVVLASLASFGLIAVTVIGVVNVAGPNAPTSSVVVATSQMQSVNLPRAWANLCASPTNESTCYQVGGMVNLGSSGVTLVTFSNGGMPPTEYGFGVFNTTNGSWSSRLATKCDTGSPYYPGFGDIAYVACYLSNGNTSVLEFNYVSGTVVGTFVTNSSVSSWGFNPSLDILYIGLSSGVLLALNPVTGATLAARTFNNPGGNPGFDVWAEISWTLLYDPFAGRVLSQAANSTVAELNPQNLSTMGQISVGAAPWAMAIDAANRALYVTTGSGVVRVFNASTFAPITTLGLSVAGCGTNYSSFLTDQILVDPAHGDLYLLGFWYCLSVVNTTGDYVVRTIPVGGDGYSLGVYEPSTRFLWVYYPIDLMLGPLVVGQFSYSTYPVLVSVLGLPPLAGELTLSLVVWAVLAYVVTRLVRRRARRRAGSSLPEDDPYAGRPWK